MILGEQKLIQLLKSGNEVYNQFSPVIFISFTTKSEKYFKSFPLLLIKRKLPALFAQKYFSVSTGGKMKG